MSAINQNQINRLFKLADLINAIQSKKKDGYKKVLNSLYDEYKVQSQGIKGSVKIPTFNTGYEKAKRNTITKKNVLFKRLRRWKDDLKPEDREPFNTPDDLINILVAGGDGLDSAYERYEEETFGRSEKKSKPKLKKPKTPANQSEILDPPDVKKSGGTAVVKKSGGTAVVNNGGGADAKGGGAPPVRPPPTAAQARNQQIIESEIKADQKARTDKILKSEKDIEDARDSAAAVAVGVVRATAEDGNIIDETDVIPEELIPDYNLEQSHEWIDQYDLKKQGVDLTNKLVKFEPEELPPGPIDGEIDQVFTNQQIKSIDERATANAKQILRTLRPLAEDLPWQVGSGWQSFDEGSFYPAHPYEQSTLTGAEIAAIMGHNSEFNSEGFAAGFKKEQFLY